VSEGLFGGGLGLCGVLVVGLIVLVIVFAVVAARKERARKEGLVGWARANGWSYLQRPASNWPARLPGHNKRGVTLALTGVVNGRTVSVGEYQYTTTSSSGPNGQTTSTTHHFVVVALRLPYAYPPLSVQRRGVFSKLGRSLFGDGKTATGNPAFDEQFKVSTKEPGSVPSLVGPSLILAHLAGQVPAWSVVGDELLTYFEGSIRDPNQIPGWSASLIRVADLLGR